MYFNSGKSLERFAGNQLARRIDRLIAFLGPEAPQGIEILESQAERIHAIVAGAAQAFAAVQLERFA